MAYLMAITGPVQGQRFELAQGRNVIGRDPECEVLFDVGAVSRRHAQILFEGRNYFIEDLKSRNGTYLNDQTVRNRHVLRSGDRVRVCDIVLTFHDTPTPSVLAATPADTDDASTRTMLVDEPVVPSSIQSKLDVATSSHLMVIASPQAKLGALLEITQAFRNVLGVDEVLPQVLKSLFKIFVQADRGFIVMQTPDGQLIPTVTKLRREGDDQTPRISRTIIRQVMDSKEAILSADAATDERFDTSQSVADFRIRSMMCAPLVDGEGQAFGALQIDTLDQRKRFSKEDLDVLVGVATQAAIAIDNARLHERALEQRELDRDLRLANEVQKVFLPSRHPDLPGYAFYNFYQPAIHIGGDYFDYIPLSDGRIAVVVADVVGHGVAAALLMAKLSAEARLCMSTESRPSQAVTTLNDRMSRLGIDRFITLISVVLDPVRHEVTIVNAGHMAPIYRQANGVAREAGVEDAGLPLGITDGIVYDQRTLKLQPGDTLVLFTDGLNEAMDKFGQCYGIDRLRQRVNAVGGDPETMGKAILEDILRFSGEGAQDDDMCLVCFQRL